MEKLSHFYTKLAIVYQFKQNKNPEEARRLANVVVRNVLGVMGFFGVLTVFTILDNFVIPVTEGISLSRYRFEGYVIAAPVIFGYLALTKKYLEPI